MKKQILKAACLLGVVLLTEANLFSQTIDELKAKIEKINKEMATAMVAGNNDKSMSYYADDIIYMPNQEEMVQGKDAIKKMDEEMMKSGSKITSFEATISKVTSCDKTVTEIGKYKIGVSMPGMTQPMEDHGKYVTLWEKQGDGSLKIKLQIWNTDVNYMAGMQNKQ